MAFRIRRLFSNLFLSIAFEEDSCILYGRVFKNAKVTKTIEAKFDDANTLEGLQKIKDYIKRQENSYHDVYLGILLNEGSQGALPTLKMEEYKNYGISPEGLFSVEVDNKFSIYADINSVIKARDIFGQEQIDAVYSPIAIIYDEILRRGIPDKTTLYLYSQGDSFCIAIFKDKALKFATFFKISDTDVTSLETIDTLDTEDITDIANLIASEEESAKNMDDFQSLDEFLNSSKDDDFADIDYDIKMPASNDVATSVAIFGKDMSIFSHITAAISEFYSNPIYNGNFIEQIVIFDGAKISATFLQYLQSELFIEVTVHNIKTLHILNDLLVREVDL